MKRFFIKDYRDCICTVYAWNVYTRRKHVATCFAFTGSWLGSGYLIRYEKITDYGSNYHQVHINGKTTPIPIRFYFPSWDLRTIRRRWEEV